MACSLVSLLTFVINYNSQPCVQAVGKTFHPEHFVCSHCGRPIGSEGFNVDRGKPYCHEDYNKLFCVKCSLCKRAIGGGDRWVEAMGEPWHASCFKCQVRRHLYTNFLRNSCAFACISLSTSLLLRRLQGS